ncbi:MAG: hypothetical protein DRQ10_06505, partial [Candidatus Hydrothermota bacterium]
MKEAQSLISSEGKSELKETIREVIAEEFKDLKSKLLNELKEQLRRDQAFWESIFGPSALSMHERHIGVHDNHYEEIKVLREELNKKH